MPRYGALVIDTAELTGTLFTLRHAYLSLYYTRFYIPKQE